MKIMNRVTFAYLKKNRKRTIVTILGVIISTAMIAAVSTFADSFLSLLQRNTIYEDGEWHAQYLGVSEENAALIAGGSNVALAGISREEGYFQPAKAPAAGREYLYLQSFDPKNFQVRGVRLTEGRLPQSPDEIVVSSSNEWGLRTGSEISGELGWRKSLETGERITRNYPIGTEAFVSEAPAAYTVVGIFEELRSNSGQTGDKAYTLLGEDRSGAVNVTVRFARVGSDVYKDPPGYSKLAADGTNYNDRLLRFMGILRDEGLMTTLYTAAAIVTVIIMAGSVLLIYNAFAISISERSRQLGMLSSVGATKKQKRNSVFFEGLLIGAAAIPLGLLFGILGIGITFTLVSPLLQEILNVYVPFRVSVSPAALVGAAAFAVLTIFISVLRPALRASRVTPIEAIRQSQDVTLTGKEVKTSRLVGRVFGFEGELALKNLKRNRRRYRSTILSLTVSLVLFLTAAAFTHYLNISYRLTDNQQRFDVNMNVNGPRQAEVEETARKGAAVEGLFNAVITPTFGVSGILDVEEAATGDFIRTTGWGSETGAAEGKRRFEATVTTMDDAALSEYCGLAGIDESLLEGNGLRAIQVNPVNYQLESIYRQIDQLKLGGDGALEVQVDLYCPSTAEPIGETLPITIVAQTPEVPIFRPATTESWDNVTLIIPYDAYWALMEQYKEQLYPETDSYTEEAYSLSIYARAADPEQAAEQMIALLQEADQVGGSVHNLAQSRRQVEQMSALVSIFLYGFIILITLISVANIFNTISTSVGLRKREFAMLKSVGMTPAGFNRMIRYESVFYGLKALLYGLPLGFAVMYGVYRVLQMNFIYPFTVPWLSVALGVAGVFAIVGCTMLYSGSKVKRAGIVDALTDENL